MPKSVTKTRPNNFRILNFGVAACALSVAFFFVAVSDWQRGLRLAKDPVTIATIEKTWKELGKGGGTFAAITFQRDEAGKVVFCRLDRFRVGTTQQYFLVGQTLRIAPRPNTCYAPDILRGPSDSGPAIYVILGCIGAAAGIILTIVGYRKSVAVTIAQKEDEAQPDRS